MTGGNLTGGHANIVELTSHHLTQAQSEDETDDTFGLVSGERLSQAVAAFESAGGGGTDDQTAAEVSVDTANFGSNLTVADTTVQAALETIDGFTQYQGNWQQAAWPAGVIVRRSGIPYLSLVNNNTEIPTPASTQWTGLSEGFIYRGEAPVAATNYNYGQVVLEPDTDVYYYFTSTISASVARADIATHANFQAISGETGHSPRVGSGNAFPTTPAPLASDIFFFSADVASGLDWKDTDGTTDLTAATAGDMARYDGTDWIKIANLIGGEVEALTLTETLPDFFTAPVNALATSALTATGVNKLSITDADVFVNRGGFSVEAGTNSLNAIKVPTAGTYAIEYSLFVQDVVSVGPATRDVILADIVVIRAGSIVSDLTSRWSKYFRAQDDTDAVYLSGTHTVDLQADDEIELLVYMDTVTVATWIIGGGQSEISLVRIVGTPTVEGIDAGVGYGSWTNIGTITGAISSAAVTVALDTDQSIDDYEEMFIHIEANDTNDQRSVSPRFRAGDVPETTLAGGGLIVGLPGNNTDEGSILVRRNADGDSLVLDPHGSVISFPATAVTTIVARSFVASTGTPAGQQSEGVDVGDHSVVILYQNLASDATPGDPPDVWDATDETYLASTGNWHEDEDDAGGGIYQWVAVGGTTTNANGTISNRAWVVSAVIAAQYCTIPQDNSTYTTLISADSRYVRFRQPNGSWFPWLPLVDSDDGWVEVTADINTFTTTGTSLVWEMPDFDADYFNEIELDCHVYGRLGSVNQEGWRAQARYQRRSGNWTEKHDEDDSDYALGTFKVNADFREGLRFVAITGPEISTGLNNNTGPSLTNEAARRINYNIHLIGKSATQLNLLDKIRIDGITAGTQYRSQLTIRMR